MPTAAAAASASSAPAVSAAEMESFLSSIPAKDRANLEKHLAVCDAEGSPTHGKVWRQVAVALRRLAPLPVTTAGQQAVLFYVADGKYKMQVFALEDKRDGALMAYVPDVLEQAIKSRVLLRPHSAPADADESGAPVDYGIAGHRPETIRIERLTAANTPEPGAHFKHMLGWNRRALRITIPTAPGPTAQTQAAALIGVCEVAAKQWAGRASAS